MNNTAQAQEEASEQRMIYLLNEDFMDFDIGEFPYDHSHTAMGEYHFVENPGYSGIWCDQVCNYTYNGSGASWIITEEHGRHFMEQMRLIDNRPHKTHPILMAGNRLWSNYTLSAKVRMFNTHGATGICFCCFNSMNLLAFVINGSEARLEYRHKQVDKLLVSVPFNGNCDNFYKLSADCNGDTVTCSINGNPIITWSGEEVSRGGKIGISAVSPAQFTDITVTVDAATEEKINQAIDKENSVISAAMDKHPEMKLYKKINLQDFGTGKQIRFGHLTGTKEWFIILAQGQKRVHRDAYGHISCLTAIDLNGNILWQRGEPSVVYEHGQIAADLPFQVYDIDGDGIDEVITSKNFELLILDGRTGNIKKGAKMPFSDPSDTELIGVPNGIYAFDRINADGIRICNFSGKERPSDILIKDRYCRIYAYNNNLELMWSFRSDKNTGHFPYAFDINKDGYDEVLCGYNLLDHKGELIWTLPIEVDHTDEIVSGRFVGDSAEGHFACVSGSQGFFIADYNGNILMKDDIGHAQRVSTGNYCPDKPGFELAVTNFWGHQGVVFFYDSNGNPLWEYENELNGNMVTPVNWDGDGSDLILLNADSARGGMLDGTGTRCVEFPDDGHPVMCVEAIDLIGDARDELVVWDYLSLYIYTQSDGYKENAYVPVKYPNYNASNYRGEYSYPSKKYIV